MSSIRKLVCSLIFLGPALIGSNRAMSDDVNTNSSVSRSAFSQAYLYEQVMPRRPTETPIHRWNSDWRIFYDDSELPSEERGTAKENLDEVLSFAGAHTGLKMSFVPTEKEANVFVVFTTASTFHRHFEASLLVDKYFGGYDVGAAGLLYDLEHLFCEFGFYADVSGQIKSSMLVIRPEHNPETQHVCFRRGVAQMLGFEGDLPDSGLFSDSRPVKPLSDLDANILEKLYRDDLKAGMSVLDALKQIKE